MFIGQIIVSTLALGVSLVAALPVSVEFGDALASREFDREDILVKRVTTSWKPSAQAKTHPVDQMKAESDIQAHIHRLQMEGNPVGSADHGHVWKEPHQTTNNGHVTDVHHVSVDFSRNGQVMHGEKHVYPGGVSTGHAWANDHANKAHAHDTAAAHHTAQAQHHANAAATAHHPAVAHQHAQQANHHAQQAHAATQAGRQEHQQAAAHHQSEANRQAGLAAHHAQVAQTHQTHANGHAAAAQTAQHPQQQAHHLQQAAHHQAIANDAAGKAQHAANMQGFHQNSANHHAARG